MKGREREREIRDGEGGRDKKKRMCYRTIRTVHLRMQSVDRAKQGDGRHECGVFLGGVLWRHGIGHTITVLISRLMHYFLCTNDPYTAGGIGNHLLSI